MNIWNASFCFSYRYAFFTFCVGLFATALHAWADNDQHFQATITETSSTANTALAVALADKPTPEQAALFLTRATFGPTEESINELVDLGYSAWLEAQFTLPLNHYLGPRLQPINNNVHALSTAPLFWQNAIAGADQLRQRMAFALSEILVISAFDNGDIRPYGYLVARYMDILQEGAFDNYRDLLEAVTYSPAMGIYLTYMGNQPTNPQAGTAPDENYAREIMQLFTLGLVELNRDGTPRADALGREIETYTNDDIMGLAKVFTGFWWNGISFRSAWTRPSPEQQVQPMSITESQHSSEAKFFLGLTIPPNTSGTVSVAMALDHLFEHPNTAPFVCRQLIQRFVTSNPSPAYVERVVNAFEAGEFTLLNGNTLGEGRRGDLRATLAAILLDPEIYSGASTENPAFGKVREPLIRFTHWARAFKIANANPSDPGHPGRYWILENTSTQDRLYQQAFRSPSVFNFFRPGYVAPGTHTAAAGLVAPELQITDASSAAGYINFMHAFISYANQTNNRYVPDYSSELALVTTPDALIDRLNLLLMNGRMNSETRASMRAAIDSITGGNSATRNRRKIEAALMIAVTAPEFLVQR